MAYEFVETLLFEMPNVEKQLESFSESAFKESHGLVIQIAAIHAGMTANYNNYSSEALAESLLSWTTPYEKPIILNHDLYSEPLGRVIGARMAQEADGLQYVSLQAAITDPLAIQKITDRRYLTGSVGGRAGEALCSVCSTDWAKPKEGMGMPCRHQRGKSYNGKVAFMDMKDVQFHEYSFVNVPADKRSKVLATASESTQTAQFFVLDLESENLFEYRESEEPRDVLAEKKKKEATPLYLNMKGAYLAALNEEDSELNGVNSHIDHTNSNDRSTEETVMADEALVAENEDDILAVTEGLSDDLSKISDEEATATEEETSDEEVTEESEEEAATDEAEEATEEEASDEEVTTEEAEEEGERPQGQEAPKDEDVDPNTSAGADVSRETDEESEVANEEETEEQVEETELSETSDNTDTEPLVEELKSEVETLKEENTRLKAALYKTLVERVVDAKIAAGVVEFEARAEAIEEHSGRSAASLKDAYLDFAKLAGRVTSTDTSTLTMNDESQVVGQEDNAVTIGEEEAESKPDPMKNAENTLVDALMGRTSLQY